MRNDGMVAGFIGLWYAIRGHVGHRRRALDRYFRINDIGVGRGALFFGSAAFWCFVLCIVSVVLLDIYMWTKAFDFLYGLCIGLLIATFVLSVLSWLMWGITSGSAIPKMKERKVTPMTISSYNLHVKDEHKADLPVEEWKPVRGLYSYWRGLYQGKDISEFWKWVRTTKKLYPTTYNDLLDHNGDIDA